jgi:hypothetical protein
VGKQGEEGFRLDGREEWGQAAEDVAEIYERIVAVTLAGGQQAEVNRCGPAATVAAAEEPVLSLMQSSA